MTTACVVNDLRDLTRRCITDIGFRFPRRADAKVQYIKLGSTAENGRLVIGNERPPEELSARNLSLKVEIFVLHLFSKSEDTGSGQERLLSYLVCEKPIGTNRQLKGAIKGKMSFPAYCSCRVAKSYLLPQQLWRRDFKDKPLMYFYLPRQVSEQCDSAWLNLKLNVPDRSVTSGRQLQWVSNPDVDFAKRQNG